MKRNPLFSPPPLSDKGESKKYFDEYGIKVDYLSEQKAEPFKHTFNFYFDNAGVDSHGDVYSRDCVVNWDNISTNNLPQYQKLLRVFDIEDAQIINN